MRALVEANGNIMDTDQHSGTDLVGHDASRVVSLLFFNDLNQNERYVLDHVDEYCNNIIWTH